MVGLSLGTAATRTHTDRQKRPKNTEYLFPSHSYHVDSEGCSSLDCHVWDIPAFRMQREGCLCAFRSQRKNKQKSPFRIRNAQMWEGVYTRCFSLTCQSEKHGWGLRHPLTFQCHLGRLSCFYDPWSFRRCPPGTRHKTVCHLYSFTKNHLMEKTVGEQWDNTNVIVLLTNEQLVDDDAHRPPVTFTAVVTSSSLWHQNFGWDVIRCPNSSVTADHTRLKNTYRHK